MIRWILFIYGIVLSFIVSSCGSSLNLEKNEKLKQIADSETQIGISCNVEIYGDECNNLENFTIVRKAEIKPEYIKSGSSIGGVVGTLTELEGQYNECSVDGETGCLTTDKYKAINISNHASKIISSENIFGVSGNYIVPSTDVVFNGTSYGVEGNLVGALSNCSGNDSGCYLELYEKDLHSLKAINFDDLYSKRSNIKNGYELVSGIEGTQNACTVGGSNCYIEGAEFRAAETSKLITGNIKNGVSLGLITGDFAGDSPDCSSTSSTGCIATAEYPSVPTVLTGVLLSTASINGTEGSIDNCSDGYSLCYINGSGFKAVETEKLIASNIKKGFVLGEVTGAYPSSTYPLVGATATTDLDKLHFKDLIVSSSSFEWFDGSGTRYTKTGDNDIMATNIRKDEEIFGVVGYYGDPLPINKIAGSPSAVAFKKEDGTVVCFGSSYDGGNCSGVAGLENVVDVVATFGAVAALKEDGSVVVWGDKNKGGNFTYSSASVSKAPDDSLSSGVKKIVANYNAFAALKSNGSVVTWGYSTSGGDSTNPVGGNLSSGVINIYSTLGAFAALKYNGSVVTWGRVNSGGDFTSSEGGVTKAPDGSLSSGVISISSFSYNGGNAFAALKDDGSVISWGGNGGNFSSAFGAALSSGVVKIEARDGGFAALKDDGSVVSTGYSGSELSSGVVDIYHTAGAFAALKDDGSVVTWGFYSQGGDSSEAVGGSLSSGVVSITATDAAFAALKENGSVVVWGDKSYGGNFTYSQDSGYTSISKAPDNSLSSGVISIHAASKGNGNGGGAFAALKNDGTVITWGTSNTGGDSSNALGYTGSSTLSGIVKIYSAGDFFVAVRENGTYVVWGKN